MTRPRPRQPTTRFELMWWLMFGVFAIAIGGLVIRTMPFSPVLALIVAAVGGLLGVWQAREMHMEHKIGPPARTASEKDWEVGEA